MNMQNSIHEALKALAIMSMLLVGACAGGSTHMRNVAPERANYAVKSDKALIVFMRPSRMAFANQSYVFDVTDGNPMFLGVISTKTKVAHYANPGKRRFMVTSESADFMDATLDAGKIYYARVGARPGVWTARFSLYPVRSAELRTRKFYKWYRGTRWVENLESGSNWARSNAADIHDKMSKNLPRWQQKANKPILMAEDGQAEPYRRPAK